MSKLKRSLSKAQANYNSARRTRNKRKSDGSFFLWMTLGGTSLTAMAVSLIGFFLALHPIEKPSEPRLLFAFGNLAVITINAWYYSVHHSTEYTFFDASGRKIFGKVFDWELIPPYLIAISSRYVFIDAAVYLEDHSFVHGPLFSMPALVVMLIASVFLLIQIRRNKKLTISSFYISTVDELEKKKQVTRKLQRLSTEELKELAGLLYMMRSLRSVTFGNFLHLIWGSVIVVFIIQLAQFIVAAL